MNHRLVVVATLIGLVSASILFGEDDSAALFSDQPASSPAAPAAAPNAAPRSSGLSLSVSGTHEAAYHQPVYGDAWNYDGEMKSPSFKNNLGIKVQDGDLTLVSRWNLDIFQNQTSISSGLTDYSNGQLGSWDGLARLRPGENYISWSPAAAGIKATVGYQVFAWGVADKINPTDNLNSRDYASSLMEPDKVPLLAADLTWYATKSIALETVFAPYKEADDWPTDYDTAVQASTGTTGAVTYSALTFSLKSFIGGLRISSRSGAGDFSASYLYDIDPYYSPDLNSAAYPLVTKTGAIELERRRLHRFGVDAKTTVGKLGLWSEACYTLTDRSSEDTIRRSKLDYVAGIDFNYGPNDSFYANIQYVGSFIPGYDSSALNARRVMMGDYAYGESYAEMALANSLGLETEGLLQGCAVNLKWELLDGHLTPEIRALYVFPFYYDDSEKTRWGSVALNPKIDFMPVDSFHIELGSQLAYSLYTDRGSSTVHLDTSTDKIGVYTPFSNVYLKVSYKWTLDLGT